ncbi:MAG: hypothetical protein WDZ35_09930 [Crocinitomicaceae bacterium]
MKNIFFYTALLLLGTACSEPSTETDTEEVAAQPFFEIAPPIDALTKEAEVFTIDNSKDTILISAHGSFIQIPQNCFETASGKPVAEAEITFKEYQNVADIFLSGIPMNCMEGEDTMTFQSAGMCEVDAKSQGEQLRIAADKKIDIGLRNRAKEGDYNLYYFNKQKGQWEERENKLAVNPQPLPQPPINPDEVDSNRILNVNIDNHEKRKRYKVWHKSKFYLLPGQQPKHANEEVFWYDMNVLETGQPDVFIVRFSGVKDGKQYQEVLLTNPLVPKENYKEAMALFRDKMRLQAKVILEESEKIKAEKLSMDSLTARMERQFKEEQFRDSVFQAEYEKSILLTTEVTRTFSVNQLGLYNCDRFYTQPIVAEKAVNFTFDDSPVDFHYSALCHPADNAVLTYVPRNNNQFKIKLSNGQYYFVGVSGKLLLCAELNASSPNGKIALQEISKEELEALVSR